MVGNRIGLRRVLQLYGQYARMDLAWFLRDTKFCVMAITADFISNVAAVAGVFLLAWRFDGVGGMDRYEVLFMLGYVTLITGIFQLFFSSFNTGHISRRIGRGQMEHMFIQPVPLWTQLLVEGFIPISGSSNFLSGSLIVVLALGQLDVAVTVGWLAALVGSLGVSTILLLALMYLSSSATFYAPVQAEEISSYVSEATGQLSSYPLSGMALMIQVPLITLFPAGLMGWFPSLVLLGKAPLGLGYWYPFLWTVGLLAVTKIVFEKGMKYYVQTGSNRYSDIGHRR